jgi:glutaredoxin-like protein NrdH
MSKTDEKRKREFSQVLGKEDREMGVTVYSLPNCVQCDSTKRMLKKNEIAFEEVDMSQDPIALEMVKSLGYTSAPVVIADEDHWSGFRMDKIQNLSA